jgi:hypothetical protein
LLFRGAAGRRSSLILIVMLSVVIVQNIGLKERVKSWRPCSIADPAAARCVTPETAIEMFLQACVRSMSLCKSASGNDSQGAGGATRRILLRKPGR